MKKNQRGFGIVEVVLIIVAVLILGALGWIAWHAISNNNEDKQASVSNSATPENSKPSDKNNVAANTPAVEYYQIASQRIEIKKDDSIKDIQATVDGNTVYFTLTGFLNSANTAGYSLIVDGVNDCERLAGVAVFKNADEVRAQGTAVTGDLIDENGDPVQGRVIKLNDGRYAEPFNHQASCGNSSSDGSDLQRQEIAANAAIRNAITNGLQPY